MAIPQWKHGPAEDIPVESYTTAISKASSVDQMSRGTVVSKRKTATKKEPDPVANIIDLIKYLALGPVAGPLTASIEHALGKEPTLISSGIGVSAAALGLPGTIIYGTTTLPAVEDEGVTGFDETTTFEPEDVKQATDPVKVTERIITHVTKTITETVGLPDIGGFLKNLGKPALLVGAALIGGYLLLKKK